MKQSYIPFVVTDGRTSQFLFQHAVMTDEAYNNYGDGSLYSPDHPKVSFSRPFANNNTSGPAPWNFSAGNFFRWEFHMIRFLEGETGPAYDVGYISDIDLHANGVLAGTVGLMSVGHDEYWTLQMRLDVQNALQNGLNLGFFSADDADWDTRLETDTINGRPNGTMVCFRNTDADPWYQDGIHDQRAVTVRFRQPPVNMAQNQMIGIEYYNIDNSSYDLGPLNWQPAWLFNKVDTGTTFLNHLIGYESDATPVSMAPIITIVAQSTTTTDVCDKCAYTTVYQPNPGFNPTVFAAGTFQWSWGLDQFQVDCCAGKVATIDRPTQIATPQMTENILAQFCGSQGCS